MGQQYLIHLYYQVNSMIRHRYCYVEQRIVEWLILTGHALSSRGNIQNALCGHIS